MYNCTRCAIEVDNTFSDWFKTFSGVRQGVHRPLLYLLHLLKTFFRKCWIICIAGVENGG